LRAESKAVGTGAAFGNAEAPPTQLSIQNCHGNVQPNDRKKLIKEAANEETFRMK